jgi:hypothetical protein
MSLSHQNPLLPLLDVKDADDQCTTFEATLNRVKNLILEEFNRQIAEHQLYYHNHTHIRGVQQRSQKILQAINPHLELNGQQLAHISSLLDLCAFAHDAIQIFVPPTQLHAPKRREMGVSETATLHLLLDSIQTITESLDSPQFTDTDLETIRTAIYATVCDYDPVQQSIYQPALSTEHPPNLVAQILAIADIGALGMEGIAAYNQEGSFLFLEENPDVIPFIQRAAFDKLLTEQPELYDNIRQRLLRRAQFQVNFAKSRLIRFPHEIANLPPAAIQTLMQDIFCYLKTETIQTIESTTPTDANTPLNQLLEFFNLKENISMSAYPLNGLD